MVRLQVSQAASSAYRAVIANLQAKHAAMTDSSKRAAAKMVQEFVVIMLEVVGRTLGVTPGALLLGWQHAAALAARGVSTSGPVNVYNESASEQLTNGRVNLVSSAAVRFSLVTGSFTRVHSFYLTANHVSEAGDEGQFLTVSVTGVRPDSAIIFTLPCNGIAHNVLEKLAQAAVGVDPSAFSVWDEDMELSIQSSSATTDTPVNVQFVVDGGGF